MSLFQLLCENIKKAEVGLTDGVSWSLMFKNEKVFTHCHKLTFLAG
jgi:hypothetical protein